MQNRLTFVEEEVIKPLTLKDISPIWAERLEEQQQQLPFPLSIKWFQWHSEIKSASKCVVEEAYGFSSSYIHECKECDRISWKFLFYFMMRSHSKLEENKQVFVKHWNERHIGIFRAINK